MQIISAMLWLLLNVFIESTQQSPFELKIENGEFGQNTTSRINWTNSDTQISNLEEHGNIGIQKETNLLDNLHQTESEDSSLPKNVSFSVDMSKETSNNTLRDSSTPHTIDDQTKSQCTSDSIHTISYHPNTTENVTTNLKYTYSSNSTEIDHQTGPPYTTKAYNITDSTIKLYRMLNASNQTLNKNPNTTENMTTDQNSSFSSNSIDVVNKTGLSYLANAYNNTDNMADFSQMTDAFNQTLSDISNITENITSNQDFSYSVNSTDVGNQAVLLYTYNNTVNNTDNMTDFSHMTDASNQTLSDNPNITGNITSNQHFFNSVNSTDVDNQIGLLYTTNAYNNTDNTADFSNMTDVSNQTLSDNPNITENISSFQDFPYSVNSTDVGNQMGHSYTTNDYNNTGNAADFSHMTNASNKTLSYNSNITENMTSNQEFPYSVNSTDVDNQTELQYTTNATSYQDFYYSVNSTYVDDQRGLSYTTNAYNKTDSTADISHITDASYQTLSDNPNITESITSIQDFPYSISSTDVGNQTGLSNTTNDYNNTENAADFSHMTDVSNQTISDNRNITKNITSDQNFFGFSNLTDVGNQTELPNAANAYNNTDTMADYSHMTDAPNQTVSDTRNTTQSMTVNPNSTFSYNSTEGSNQIIPISTDSTTNKSDVSLTTDHFNQTLDNIFFTTEYTMPNQNSTIYSTSSEFSRQTNGSYITTSSNKAYTTSGVSSTTERSVDDSYHTSPNLSDVEGSYPIKETSVHQNLPSTVPEASSSARSITKSVPTTVSSAHPPYLTSYRGFLILMQLIVVKLFEVACY